MRVLLVGLTGGIGCGKTEAARVLQKLGAKVIDADAIGKQVVEENSAILRAIKKNFGSSCIDAEGKLKRKELGRLVFADEKQKKKLNDLVHPHLLKGIRKAVEKAKKENWGIIIVDAALIYETGLEKMFDHVIVVYSELKHRVERVKKRDRLSDQEILNRIQSQMPLDEKVRRADIVLSNDDTVEALRLETEKLFYKLQNATDSGRSKIALLKK